MALVNSNVDKAIANLNKQIEDAADGTASDLANRGRNVAYRNAPDGSGKLRKFIRPIKVKKGHSRVISHNPSIYKHDSGFSLPNWLHANSSVIDSDYRGIRAGYFGRVGNPQNHLNSGYAKYMERAYFTMIRIAEKEFDKNFDITISTTTF